MIPTRLVLKIKLASDGSIDKMKARCCVLGFRQQSGLDYNPDNVYSPMTEPTTVRALLDITNKLGLRADHLDIHTAFLNGILPPEEQFYCSPPPGFSIPKGKHLLADPTRSLRSPSVRCTLEQDMARLGSTTPP